MTTAQQIFVPTPLHLYIQQLRDEETGPNVGSPFSVMSLKSPSCRSVASGSATPAPRLSRTASPIEAAVGVETPAMATTKRPSLQIPSRSRANSLASSSRPSLSRAGSPTEGVQLSSEERPGTAFPFPTEEVSKSSKQEPDSSGSILWQVARRLVGAGPDYQAMDAGEKYDDECSSVFAASSLMRRRQKLLLRKAAVGEGLEGTDDQAAPRLSRTASPIEVAVGVETPAAEPTKRPSLPILSRSRANSLASSSRPSLSRAGSPTEGVQLSSEEGPGTGPDSSSSILWQVAKRFVRQLSPAEGEAASAGTAFPFPTEEVAKPSPHQQVDSSGSAKGVAVDAEEEEDGCSSVLSAFSSPERFETAAAWDSVDVPEDEGGTETFKDILPN